MTLQFIFYDIGLVWGITDCAQLFESIGFIFNISTSDARTYINLTLLPREMPDLKLYTYVLHTYVLHICTRVLLHCPT